MIRLLVGEIPGPALCRSIVQVGIGVALQSTLLLGLGLLAGRIWQRRGPALPALIYQVTLVAALLGGLLSVALGGRLQPFWRLSLPPADGSSVRDPRSGPWPAAWPGGESAGDRLLRAADFPKDLPPLLAGSRPGGAVQARPDRARPGRENTPPGDGAGWVYEAIAGIWGAGALALLSWLLLCQLHLGRLRRGSLPIRHGDAAAALADLSRSLRVRPPLLQASPQVCSPCLTGLWRPAILLPASCEREFDGPALRALLAHELIHLARRDCAWNLLARLTCAAGWVQPLLWLFCRRLQQASEEVCDQEVVRVEGDPCAYAQCLLVMSERFLPSPPESLLGVGVVPFRSGLGRRIQQILDHSRHRMPPLSARLRAAVALSAASAVLLGLFLVSAAAAPPTRPRPPSSARYPPGFGAGSPDATEGGAAAATGTRHRPVLAEAAGLAKRVTYSETKIPLSELVQKVAVDTGVPLAAAREVADEPVAVVVNSMPARELLEQLADLLDYQWHRISGPRTPNSERRTPVLEIYQDLASKQREEALRQARPENVTILDEPSGDGVARAVDLLLG